jgi:hypothetical protein
MGLYGTRHIVESLGGAILYATSFRGGNPIFAYIVPKDPSTVRPRDARDLRMNIVNGNVPLVAPSFI